MNYDSRKFSVISFQLSVFFSERKKLGFRIYNKIDALIIFLLICKLLF